MADLDWTNIITAVVTGLGGFGVARATAKGGADEAESAAEASTAVSDNALEGQLATLKTQLATQAADHRLSIQQAVSEALEAERARDEAVWRELLENAFDTLRTLATSPDRKTRKRATDRQFELVDDVLTSERGAEYLRSRSYPLVADARRRIQQIEANSGVAGSEGFSQDIEIVAVSDVSQLVDLDSDRNEQPALPRVTSGLVDEEDKR